jgi:predicted DNA-binding protein (UPF0251 family)
MRRIEEAHAMRHPETGIGAPGTAEQVAIDREQAEALHGEVERLPKAFRVPLVLCYFEGLSLAEAARRLRCPAGTVHSRLDRAREKLRRALVRRGIVLSTAGLAAGLSPRTATASIPPPLCGTTTRAALAFAARHTAASGALTAPAAALAREVIWTMLIDKLRTVALTVVALAAVAIGVGPRALDALAQAREGEPPGEPNVQAARAEPRPPDPDRPAPGRMFVVGRVLDPDGRPVPDAVTMAYARSKALGHSPRPARMSPIPIGEARTDGSGAFRLDLPRTSSRYDTFGVLAIAPGYGAAGIELDPDAERPAADIPLRREHAVRGRFLDLQGRPAVGVAVRVGFMGRATGRQRPGGRGEQFEDALRFWWASAQALSAWPRPAITDDAGWFTLHGIGRGLRVTLRVDDHRFASQRIEIDTDDAPESRPLLWTLEPARIIRCRVTYADTGAPAPHASLTLSSLRAGRSGLVEDFETDDQGRSRINPEPGDHYTVTAWPPAAAAPYLYVRQGFDWPKGAVEQALDLALPRGVLIRGRVTEEGTGRPIEGATTTFFPHEQLQNPAAYGRGSPVLDTSTDGSFEIGAAPSPGYLAIAAPSDDYVLQEIGSRMAVEGRPGGQRFYSHANIPLELRPGIDREGVNVVLRRGATVTGRVVGPDGQPIREAWMFGRIILGPQRSLWRGWEGDYHGLARDGRFEVHGLGPDAEVPVSYLEPRRKLGATVRLSGRSAAGGPITVRLEPCGAAVARLVDPGGKPVAGWQVRPSTVMMVVTPGAVRLGPNTAGLLHADESGLTTIDPINHGEPLVSDAQGRIEIPALIPGAAYRFIDRTTVRDPSGPRIRKEFTVQPGGTLDLGDVLIERPR